MPLFIDLHAHTFRSGDSMMTIEDLALAAKSTGLHGFAITDHNSVEEVKGLKGKYRLEDKGLLIVPGLEVTTAAGHILAYGDVGPIPTGMPTEEAVDRVISAGGVPVAAHPFRLSTGIGEAVVRRCRFQAMEVFNGRTREGANMKALALAKELKLPMTGGSDAHFPEQVGEVVTVFPDDATDIEAVLKAIKGGDCKPEGRQPTTGRVVQMAGSNTIKWLKRGMRRR